MRSFAYEALAGRVVFGPGSISTLPRELDRLGADQVLLIADDMAKADADTVEADLGGRVIARIGEIQPHVPEPDVESARRLTTESGVDAVVTVGGGSTTGLGKAILLEHDVVFAAVPTTYAGSEMTPIYGITSGEVKRTGRDPRVKPGLVIYDVDLTMGLPAAVTAGSVMNALAHCVEALYARERNPIVSLMALEGVRALKRGAIGVSRDPRDQEGRSDLQYGAFLAGAALGSVGMAVHHRICHVLGGTFGLAHGDANAVILPYVVAYNRSAEPEVMNSIAGALGVEDPAAGLRELAEALGAPTSLSSLGMTSADIEKAAEMVDEGAGYNPRPVKRAWVMQLLEEALAGQPPSRQEGQ